HASYCNRAPLATFGMDQIAAILAFYLMIGPSGAMYSLDSLLRRRRSVRREVVPSPPLRGRGTGERGRALPDTFESSETRSSEEASPSTVPPLSLALSPAAGARGPENQYLSAGLALRLIQVHYCIIYFFAGVSKLQGRTWWTGEALWR